MKSENLPTAEDLPAREDLRRPTQERRRAWGEADEWQRDEARRRLELLSAVPLCAAVEVKRSFLERYVERTPAEELPRGVSLSTLYSYKRDFAAGGVPGLLPKPVSGRPPKVDPRDYERFRTLYLTREARSASECYRRTRAAAAQRRGVPAGELEGFPCARTFDNTLRRREPEAVIVMARHGVEEYRRWQQQRQPRREAQQRERRPQHETTGARAAGRAEA